MRERCHKKIAPTAPGLNASPKQSKTQYVFTHFVGNTQKVSLFLTLTGFGVLHPRGFSCDTLIIVKSLAFLIVLLSYHIFDFRAIRSFVCEKPRVFNNVLALVGVSFYIFEPRA